MPRERFSVHVSASSAFCRLCHRRGQRITWMVGQYGGGAFVVCYVLFLLILGLPIMTMEFAIGRASQKSPVRAYQALEKRQVAVHPRLSGDDRQPPVDDVRHHRVRLDVVLLLPDGQRPVGATSEQVQAAFPEMLGMPVVMTVCMVAVVITVGFMINSFGLQGGLERVTNVMMIILLAIMVVLAINSIPDRRLGRGSALLSDSGSRPYAGVRHRQRYRCRDESGVLHAVARHRRWLSSAAISARAVRCSARPSMLRFWIRS